MDAQVSLPLLQLPTTTEQTEWLQKNAPHVNLSLIHLLQQEARQRERQNPHHALIVAQLVHHIAQFWGDGQTKAVGLHIEADARRLLFEHDKALKLYQEAANIYQSLGLELEAAHIAVGQIATMKYLGRYEEAITLSYWVSDVFKVANEQTALGKIVMNRGNIYARQKRFSEALASFTEAQAIFRESQDQHHLAIVNVNEANIHVELDNFRQAEKIYQQVRPYFQQQELNYIAAQVDHNVAHLHMAQGNYQEALVTFNKARELFLAQENNVQVASIDLMRSDIYLTLNLWQEALDLAQKSLQTVEEANMPRESARFYLNEAAALAHINPKETPTEPLMEARRLFAQEENFVWLAMTDLYQATFDWRHKGNLESASQMAQQAEHTFKKYGFRSRAAQCAVIQGEIALIQQDYKQASAYFSQGIDYLQNADIPAVSFACLFGLGRTHQYQNQFAKALCYYRQAIADIERLQAAIGAEDYKIAFLSDKLQVYEAMVLLCLDMKTAVTEKEAFETVERAKSRTLLDSLAREKPLGTSSPAEADLWSDINRLKNELNWYYNQINQPHLDNRSPTMLANLADVVTRRERALNQYLKQWHSPDLITVPRNPIWTITLEKIQTVLPENTLLLEFYTTAEQMIVFGVSKSEIWSHQYSAPISRVSEYLSEFRFQINKFSYEDSYRQRHKKILKCSTDNSLQKLYQALIAPLEDRLAADTVVIVPHGFLHYIPFHALFDGESYLIEKRIISYVPSATILYHSLTAVNQHDYSKPVILGLSDQTIPHAAEEAKAIARLFRQADVRLQEKATVPNEIICNKPPSFVHLATHATFRADNPLFSAVKLADRWLSVNDIYGMDVNVPLITLSACETGRNQVLVGDELVGLCRGFFAAGVRSMVVSLWMVDDQSTTQLMTKFYQGLQAGLPVNQALRNAQLAIKAMLSTEDDAAHPYYWAPFILTGGMKTEINLPDPVFEADAIEQIAF